MNQTWAKVLSSFILTRISERSSLQKIVANIGWLFVDKMLSIVAGLFVGAWMARYLGPAQFGLYSYAIAFVSLFAPLAGLGLGSIVIRNIVHDLPDKDEILGTAFILQSTASLLVLVLAIGSAYLIRPGDTLARWLIAIMGGRVVFEAFSNAFDYWFQSQVQSKYTVWAKNTALVLIALVKVSLILLRAPLIAFAWAALAEIVLFGAALAIWYHVSGQRLAAWRGSFLCAKRLLKDSWPLILSGLAVVIYMRVDQIMLGDMAGEEALGIYSAAVRLSELWYFIPMAVAGSVFPAIVRSRESQSDQVYRQRMQAFYDVMAGIGYTIGLPLALIASPLVVTLFGAEYVEAGSVLRVHVWAFLFVSLGVARSQWLVAENMVQVSMFTTILGAVVNVMLNYWLIPQYAGLGAAWATVIAQAIATYLSCVFSTRLWPVFRQLSLSLLVPLRLFSLRKSLLGFL